MFQASDFSNVGDWPILGKVPVHDNIRKPMTNVKETPTASAQTDSSSPAASKTTTTTTTSTKQGEKEVSTAQQQQRSNRSSSRSKSATNTSNDPAQSPVNAAAATTTTTTTTNTVAATSTALTNGNAKRTAKQRWVPLDIDLSKSRSKRDSTPRNKRRDIEYEDDYSSERPTRSSRRYRTSSYRGGRSSAIGRGGKRSGVNANAKTSTATRNRNDADYSDYPSEYTLVNKVGGGTDVPPFMMPYLGTYYYNGVPGFVNMDSLNIKDAIKKQM